MLGKTAIVLFSDDFRILDNPALYNAAKVYQNIIPLYIYNESYLGRGIGAAAKVFLNNALKSFDALLNKEYGVKLIIKSGDYIDVLKQIVTESQINAIYFNHSYSYAQIDVESSIKKIFCNIDVKSFKAKVLFEPWVIKPSSGGEFYKVFTPFAKECLKNTNLVGEVCPKPENITSKHNIPTLTIDELCLLPKNEGDWHTKLLKYHSFDYDAIEQNFINFINTKLTGYKDNRNTPSANANSGISPYLRFGMLSVRSCFNAVMLKNSGFGDQFALELLWRDFAYHVMFYNQDIADNELKPEYSNFVWDGRSEYFDKWKFGKTGFDIVDASMNELWQTGVMHNRTRMVVASFLTKDLFINWRLGENWFWNTLVDADVAVNPFSWQWVFGSGFDAAPYFRIFNPDSQKQRFDPDGQYCSKWLPKTWTDDRIVSHEIQRDIALKKYKNLQV